MNSKFKKKKLQHIGHRVALPRMGQLVTLHMAEIQLATCNHLKIEVNMSGVHVLVLVKQQEPRSLQGRGIKAKGSCIRSWDEVAGCIQRYSKTCLW